MSLPKQSIFRGKLRYEEAQPELVIGLDYAHLTTAVAIPRIVKENEPITVNTKLGWVTYGVQKNGNSTTLNQHQQEKVFAACSIKRRLEDLEEIINEYFTNESLGVVQQTTPLMSKNNERATKLMQHDVKYLGDRYEVGLLWKTNEVKMPDSFQMARRRLGCVKNKMLADSEFSRQYEQKINDYINKGYAQKLSTAETLKTTNKSFYLPHFAVTNPNKKGLRVVFDAAAKINETSLNQQLLPGPDLTCSLLTILAQFRKAPIAICGDIKEMFLQIKIKADDQQAQRFLWQNEINKNKVDTYIMTRMLFGATCSPVLAQFVKNYHAMKFEEQYPRAVKGIIEHHYVDDYVDCFDTVTDAKQTIKEIIKIHETAGFELRNFTSNSKSLLQSIGVTETNDIVDLNHAEIERVLGMYWDTQTDEFKFLLKFHKIKNKIVSGDVKPTKREVLSLVMSVFDPFGILGNLVITGKLFMQALWKLGIKWDEPIPDDIFQKWRAWLNDVNKAQQVAVPRCYHQHFSQLEEIELHIFADASESAIAASAYFRIKHQNNISVQLACAKTRCAPIKYTSIPRLELQAAVIAVRLKRLVLETHKIQVQQIQYWTDSMTVMNWVHSDSRRYKQYVANRLGEILENSRVSEWNWVPSEDNVADDGTRISIGKYEPNGRWINGPEFLKTEKTTWKKQPKRFIDNNNEEEIRKTEFIMLTKSINVKNTIIKFERFPNLQKLIRTVAFVRRFAQMTRKTKYNTYNNNSLTSEELEEAEKVLCRIVQQEEYAEEYEALQQGNKIKSQSRLIQFNPFIDEWGILRISGRLEKAACMSADEKHLILLPKQHQFSIMIVNHYHQKFRHVNRGTIICEIRRKYWIPSLRALVKKTEANCNLCKLKRKMPQPPMMGLLPVDRLTPHIRAFSYCGLDYFGPFLVTIGRQKQKRWVALFTCLTTRAVHLELAADLSTDACLICIKNFINRRGIPTQMRSDNGTNFVGINKELQGVTDYLDQGALEDKLANWGIKWKFNCPSNPSEGGIWERLVQSVKKVMTMTLKEYAPRVETLNSLLIEAENIVNSRPLTHVPVSSDEAEPLTPNHFLLGTTNSTQTPGSDEARLLCLRKQWRIAQTLKNGFWKRWVREYLPDLTRRVKWCQPTKPMEEGDLVMVCELPRSAWPRGRILRLIPGSDGISRAAEIQVGSSKLKRPISKLAKLDIQEE